MQKIKTLVHQIWINWRQKGLVFAMPTPIVLSAHLHGERFSPAATLMLDLCSFSLTFTRRPHPVPQQFYGQLAYHTAYFGKWHCGVVQDQEPDEVRQNRQDYTRWPMCTPEYHRGGFQDWFGFEVNNAPFEGFYYHQNEVNPRKINGYQTDVLTDMAIRYLNEYGHQKPLFLVLSVEPPHFPLGVPDQFMRFDPSELKTQPNFSDTPEMREKLATYYAMIENLDWNIGRLSDALSRNTQFTDNTLTVYFSDHGDFMGNHGLFERKENPHQESVRVPAIFHWPNQIPAQGMRNELFSLVDMLPTTLGLLEMDMPSYLQGKDFSSALLNKPFVEPNHVLLEMCGNPRWNLDFLDWRGLVTNKWKYTYYETGHELLFDLEEDPYEQTNLVDSQTEIRNQLRQQLLRTLAETREPYFDVLIEHGVGLETPVIDVSTRKHGGISPTWDKVIQTN
ncbi:MAG: sulfatase-like hydrolase/transferase [Candidatus Poribacteria bacterium]|nr:sulfatase-like hydrolase/transferase [Candidatus Poribacteria bacterium]